MKCVSYHHLAIAEVNSCAFFIDYQPQYKHVYFLISSFKLPRNWRFVLHSEFSGFQIQLTLDLNPEQIPQPPCLLFQGFSGAQPREETGTYRGLEEHFDGEIIAVLEDDTGQIEVLVATIESTTPFIEEDLN